MHAGVAKLWHRGLTRFVASDGLSWVNSINATRNWRSYRCRRNRGTLVPVPVRRHEVRRQQPSMPGVSPGWGWSQTVLQDRTGDWWIGTNKGLFRFTNLKTIDDVSRSSPSAIYTTRDGLAGPQVLRLFEDSRGDVWIGTVGGASLAGLSRWQRKTGTFRHFTDADGLPALDQGYVVVVRRGSGRTRVDRLQRDRRTGRVIRMGASCASPRLTACQPGASRTCCSTRRGASGRRPTGRAYPGSTRPKRSGPRSSRTPRRRACPATPPAPWLKIPGGASTSRPAAASTASIRQAAGSNTIQRRGVPTAAHAAVRDGHGALWFTAASGVVRLVPQIDPVQRPPPILITALSVGGRARPISALGEPDVRLTEPSSRNTHLQIDFVSLGFSHGEELRYQYMLEGAENAWSPPSTQRTVNYATLAPGSYRFLVRAVNSDAMASDTPASVSFTVLPPIWWRWWFIVLVAMAVAAAAYMLHRARVIRLLEVARIRTGIATDLHDDIGANLTRIAILSEVARRQEPVRDARPAGGPLAGVDCAHRPRIRRRHERHRLGDQPGPGQPRRPRAQDARARRGGLCRAEPRGRVQRAGRRTGR